MFGWQRPHQPPKNLPSRRRRALTLSTKRLKFVFGGCALVRTQEFSDRVEVGLFYDSESESMALIVGQESSRYTRHFCCAIGLSTSRSWKYHVQKVGQFHSDLRLCRGAHLPAQGEGVAAGRSSRKLASCRQVLFMRCFKTSYQTKSSLESNFMCDF